MKAFLPMLALALAAALAAGARAQPQDVIVLPGRGGGFIAYWVADRSIEYDVDDPTAPLINSDDGRGAGFGVFATRPYTVEVSFPTWLPGAPAPPAARRGAFSNGQHRIGGRLWLDPPGRGRGQGQGASGGIVFQDDNGQLRSRGPRGLRAWRLGADIDPRQTDHPGGLAPAGRYSLDAQITVLPW
jgi:hypothetical protein